MSGAGLDSLYQEVIMDHSKQRHGAGLREDAATSSHQLNPTCGDELTLNLHVNATGDTIDSVSWDGQGCVISQASMSMLHDLLGGLPVAQVEPRLAAFREMMRSKGQIEGDPDLLGDAVALAGVSRYVARVKCAMLGWVALEDAVRQLPPPDADLGHP
ncbi:Fe-S cluster assembly sulfur transfer protein SufU [Homoserinimonas sp. OAct 916]|uniref:Fe-S cluster assembly sulfur transfer protein SufU n=1 Tax=Homoserinimonas sp. OAct 916 TaxID=2211450 RepID=UPI000DBE5CEC|nr:SUF system NifU family Fe-S cluster assembly protein [Homoserinimonas sp. OAct 916]